jgi:hypothetical protein
MIYGPRQLDTGEAGVVSLFKKAINYPLHFLYLTRQWFKGKTPENPGFLRNILSTYGFLIKSQLRVIPCKLSSSGYFYVIRVCLKINYHFQFSPKTG